MGRIVVLFAITLLASGGNAGQWAKKVMKIPKPKGAYIRVVITGVPKIVAFRCQDKKHKKYSVIERFPEGGRQLIITVDTKFQDICLLLMADDRKAFKTRVVVLVRRAEVWI